MGRIKNRFERPEPFRDSNLIVIATEGAQTEKQYFETLKEYFFNSRIRVKVIPNENNKSSPSWVYDNLKKYKEECLLDLSTDDKLFLVIDKDRWPENELVAVSQKCKQNNFGFIVSNPCFELWIILHLMDLSILDAQEKELYLKNKKVNKNRTYIESKIVEKIGSYNKANPDFKVIMDSVNYAVTNSKKIDINIRDRWPNSLGTRVYLVAEEILK